MTKVLQNKDKSLGLPSKWKVITMTLLLLTFSIGQMWGDQTYHSITPNICGTAYETYYMFNNASGNPNSITTGYSSSTIQWAAGFSAWVEGTAAGKDNSGNTGSIEKPGFISTDAGDLKINGHSITFHVTNCTGVAVLGKGNGSSKQLHLSVKEKDSDTEVDEVVHQSNTVAVVAYGKALSASKSYDITVSSTSGGNSYIYQVRFTAPSAISLTGTTSNASATVGESAGTMTCNAYSATSYQWYRNTIDSKTGATAISGAESSTYSPNEGSAGTYYYYCKVETSQIEAPAGGCEVESGLSGAFVFSASSCAATIPGNISKGTATGGTGAITLTAAGEVASGDTWYWQSTADGEDKTGTSGPTKNVSAAGNYYIRSYNTAGDCWSNAKSVEVVAADLLTPITPTLTYEANVFVGNTLSPTLTGNDGSGTVTYALNDVTPAGSLTIVESTGVVTAVTAGGTATVTATIAANGNYAGNTATSGTITAVAVPTHLVENRLNVTSGDWSSNIYTNDPTNITSLTEWQIAAGQDRTAGVTDKQSIKNGRTHGIGTTTTKTDGYYMYLSFTIASGKRLKLSAVNIPVFGIAAGKTTEVEIEDANSTKISVTGAITQDADGNGFGTYDFSGAPYLQGAVTLKMWAYGATSGYRMKSPIYLDGAISEVDVTAPTFVSSVPANSATGVDVSGTIVLTFSEAIASVDGSKFTLTGATKGAVAIDGTDATKVNIAYSGAANEATVTLTTAAEAVADASGNKSAALSDIAFTTAASGVCVKPDAPEDLGVDVKTNKYAKFSWDGGSAGANGYEIALVSASGAGTFGWTDEDAAIYEVSGLTPETEYTFKVKYKGTVDDCYSDEVTTTFTTYAACTELVPETSGDSPSAIGDEIRFQEGSTGGKMYVADNKAGKTLAESFTYTANGISLNTGGQDSLRVELSSLMKVGTVISAEIYNANNDKVRGLLLQNMTKTTKATWTTTMVGTHYETYTVVAGDGLAGSNKFLLARSETAALKSLTVSNCGDAVYEVTFDMKSHGTQVAKQVLTAGAKVAEPAEPEAVGYIFGGWYKETTLENTWNFSTDVVPSNNMTLYAKWTEDPCTDRQSLSKVVLTSTSAGTTTGYNSNEYAGTAVIGGLSGTATAEVDPSHEGTETGYKLNSGGSAIVFATLKKGTFQEGDKVVVTITKANDAYKVEEVSQPILDIYFGDSKDDATLLKTLNGVTAAGSYTYRLTAADVTAIGDKKGIGVFRPSSGRTQNPHVYSVEITGCRSFAVTHQVTFNGNGHCDPIAPQDVAEGDKVTKPTVVADEGWALVGWYKEEGLVNEWNFASDVMGTSDITLYAKWESEAGAIKLFDGEGNLNTTNFISPAKTTIEISSVTYPCLAEFSSNRTSLGGATPADMVQYNATTDKAKIKMTFYNNNSGVKKAILYKYEEGAEAPEKIEIEVPGQTIFTTEYYTFNSSKNRSFYVCMNDRSNIRVLQIKVMDNGTTIQKAGQAGYSVTFNKGRMYVKNGEDTPFEGMTINASSEYKVYNNSNLATSSYISFTNAVANTIFKVTRSSSNAYYITNDLEDKGTSYTTDKEVALTTTGTWYIGAVSSGSAASFTKFEFVAPKCEQPTVADMSDVELCAGAAYTALAVSASVSDEGTLHYAWFKEAGATDEAVGSDAASYTPEADGEYYVIVTNKKDGFSDNSKTSNTISVAHFAGTTITGYANASGAAGATGKQISVTAEGAGTLHYVWYTCDDELGTNPVAIEPANDAATLSNITIPTGTQYYKVVVTGNCGSAEQILFAKEWSDVELQDVTGSMTWNWKVSENPDAWTGIDGDITIASTSVLANVNYGQIPNVANFHSAMLKAVVGTVETKIRKSTDGGVIQGNEIMFHTTVPGIVIVTYRGTGNSANVTLTIGSETLPTYAGGMTTSKKVFVPAGDVVISSGSDAFRIQKIQFIAEADYTRDVTQGRYGTICLPNGGVMVGAAIFEIAYFDVPSSKIYFDEILDGTMVAGNPYIFLPYDGVSTLGVYYTDALDVEAGHVNGLYGSYTEEVLDTDGSNYILLNNQYCRVVNPNTRVGANRAYIKLEEVPNYPTSAPLPGRRRVSMSVQGVQAPTGLDELNAGDAPIKVMINGELFILRGEKMYDATGRLVK